MTSKARTTEDDGKVTDVKPADDTTEPDATKDDDDAETNPATLTNRLGRVEDAMRLHGLMP